MSAAPRYPHDVGFAGLRMTAEEFFALGETPDRYELIDGVVVMSPSPALRHQVLIRYLLRELESTAAGRDSLIAMDTDVRLSGARVYCPDVLIYAPGRFSEVPERLTTPPDLIIEVLSPGSKPLDLITKRDDYDAFGVGEYWAVDPSSVTARVWRRATPTDKRMLEAGTEGDVLECAAVPGLRVDWGTVRKAMGSRKG